MSGFWSRTLGKSLGLNGKFYVKKNLDPIMGEAPEYILMKCEAPSDMVVESLSEEQHFKNGEEVVLAFTPHEFLKALDRAMNNPEDIAEFLKQHALEDLLD